MKRFKIFVESKYKKPQDIQVGDLLDGIDAPYEVIKVDKDHFVTRDASGVELVHDKKGGALTLYEDKEYTAFVRDGRGNAEKITRSYPSMKQFKQDLRGNGYRVMSVVPADEVGTSDWERKLYDNREKRKERKLNRIRLQVDANNYAREKAKPLWDRWHELIAEKDKVEFGSPQWMKLSTEADRVYDEYKSTRDAAEAEYKAQHKK